MHWNKIAHLETLKDIVKDSFQQPLLLFKHSTTCSISAMALGRLERNWGQSADGIRPYMINVLSERPISNEISNLWQVQHESPQALVIRDGKCIYNESHSAINYNDMLDAVATSLNEPRESNMHHTGS
jgi:bacillithiol system protein YtxJ